MDRPSPGPRPPEEKKQRPLLSPSPKEKRMRRSGRQEN